MVSRFPAASETFVVRELNAVAAAARLELSLMSLFPSTTDSCTRTCPLARRLLHRPRAPEAAPLVAGAPAAATARGAWR